MRHRVQGRRSGHTLIECLVALTLLAVGLLATAGTAAAVQRLGAAGSSRARAAALVSARLEALRATPCASRGGGSATANGIVERWSVASGGGVTVVVDSLSLPPGRDGVARGLGVVGALPC